MEERIRGRLRLMLRSERALGLTAVPGFPLMAIKAKKESGSTSVGRSAPAATARPVARAVAATSAGPARSVAKPSAAIASAGAAPLVLPASALPFEGAALPAEEKRMRLEVMNDTEVKGCTRCRLCETRTNTVFGEGDPDAKIFFIGEGPGENEDLQGRPFIGRAGELLTKMIVAMGLQRADVFIANIVKCRPPNNRIPAPDEVATCTPYLVRQLEIVRPKVIVTLGLPSTRYMLQSDLSMGKLRGQFHQWRGIKLMPTYHPAYVLRSYTEATRAAVWSDLKKVMAEIGLG